VFVQLVVLTVLHVLVVIIVHNVRAAWFYRAKHVLVHVKQDFIMIVVDALVAIVLAKLAPQVALDHVNLVMKVGFCRTVQQFVRLDALISNTWSQLDSVLLALPIVQLVAMEQVVPLVVIAPT
jgi:hypothetical protein